MKRNTAALVVISTTILVGTYTALRVGRATIHATPPTEAPLTNIFADAPTLTPTYESCAYVWAYEDLPEISAQVDQAFKETIPEAYAHATAFGEECVFADGRAEFGAMETDFYITLPADDLTDHQELGDQISAGMRVILDRFPRETLPGNQEGFVEFRFEKSEADFLIVRVPIQKYKSEARGASGAELFEIFYLGP